MNRSFQTLVVTILMINSAMAQVKWTVDPTHTHARFNITRLGINLIDGQFTRVKGSVDAPNKESFDNAKIDFTIDATSIDTHVTTRDRDLKSADFFYAEQYPNITLKTISFKKAKNNKYILIADLTIRGVTKKVTFDVTQNGEITTDQWEKTRADFTVKTTINRFDFGMKHTNKLPFGLESLTSNVKITVNTELVLNK
ncbi:YceI family protein [Sphingobacterium sp. SRCM116780]|uniref:YceI family protein n=1 Tax=Sphingobacterium sp. SRCM116780 TaxID=2907623 RepID=UPI001F2E642B|nr:YceI family protein [Sphingobacterium sp. SRCM116780]UIR54584.1 YceI family protein [Sphingobacterium sp. SRCM116780]